MENKKPDVFYYNGGVTKLELYHGSKYGLNGPIKPKSRKKTDFGKGFYMGTTVEQPKTLICDYEEPVLYKLNVNLNHLKCVEVNGIPWAMLVAYNRGEMKAYKNTPLYNQIANITRNYDMIIGPIVDDRMFVVLERFFKGQITDRTLLKCMRAMALGMQYVAKTNLSCDENHIEIVYEHQLQPTELIALTAQARKDRTHRNALADQYIHDERRNVTSTDRFFDEILKEGEQNELDIVPNPTL